jgi:prolyl 4-hydroxylase
VTSNTLILYFGITQFQQPLFSFYSACKTCHLIDMANRCPELPDAVPGLKPGDMNAMFERIVDYAPGNRTLSAEHRQQLVDSNMTEFSVVVHSRPNDEPDTKFSLSADKKLPPWVITLENFLTDEECDLLIEHGYKEGYKRSEDVGKQRFDGTADSVKSQGRTSENAWCSSRTGCRQSPLPAMIHQRVADILKIPPNNSEDFQILKYEVGQCK